MFDYNVKPLSAFSVRSLFGYYWSDSCPSRWVGTLAPGEATSRVVQPLILEKEQVLVLKGSLNRNNQGQDWNERHNYLTKSGEWYNIACQIRCPNSEKVVITCTIIWFLCAFVWWTLQQQIK